MTTTTTTTTTTNATCTANATCTTLTADPEMRKQFIKSLSPEMQKMDASIPKCKVCNMQATKNYFTICTGLECFVCDNSECKKKDNLSTKRRNGDITCANGACRNPPTGLKKPPNYMKCIVINSAKVIADAILEKSGAAVREEPNETRNAGRAEVAKRKAQRKKTKEELAAAKQRRTIKKEKLHFETTKNHRNKTLCNVFSECIKDELGEDILNMVVEGAEENDPTIILPPAPVDPADEADRAADAAADAEDEDEEM